MGNQNQNQKPKSIFTRENFKKYGTGAVLSAGAMGAMSNASALDVAGALSSSDANSNIETGAVWVLGIMVTIFAARRVIGFFKG